jgi:prepilin-type N-terminal cleavage/methylation domain-containing protein
MTKNGFTILELVATLMIIGLLVGIGTPVYLSHVKEARVTEAKLNMDRILLQMKSNLTRYGYMGVGETVSGSEQQFSCTKADLESRLGMTLPQEIKLRWNISVDIEYSFIDGILHMTGLIEFTGTSALPFHGNIKVIFNVATLQFTVE